MDISFSSKKEKDFHKDPEKKNNNDHNTNVEPKRL